MTLLPQTPEWLGQQVVGLCHHSCGISLGILFNGPGLVASQQEGKGIELDDLNGSFKHQCSRSLHFVALLTELMSTYSGSIAKIYLL